MFSNVFCIPVLAGRQPSAASRTRFSTCSARRLPNARAGPSLVNLHWFFQRFLSAGACGLGRRPGHQPYTFFHLFRFPFPKTRVAGPVLRICTYFQGFRSGAAAHGRPPARRIRSGACFSTCSASDSYTNESGAVGGLSAPGDRTDGKIERNAANLSGPGPRKKSDNSVQASS